MNLSNLLIRVPNWLGDTMMATPVVSAAREMFPKSKISILSKPAHAGFWGRFPGVDKVLVLGRGFSGFWKTADDVRKNNFDAALILPSSFSSAFLVFAAGVPFRAGWGGEGRELFLTKIVKRSDARKKHLVLEYLELLEKGFGKRLSSRPIQLWGPMDPEARKKMEALLRANQAQSARGLVALCPGATYGPAKRWPLSYWVQLISRLLQEGRESILVLGGPEERRYLEPLMEKWGAEKSRVHLLAGQTPTPVLAAVLSKSKLLITNDTGPMHVAAAVGTPTVALFGSTSPLWTRPFGKGHEVIYKHLECSPCFQKTCPIGYKCLHAISVEEVFQAALKKLKRPGKIQPEKRPT